MQDNWESPSMKRRRERREAESAAVAAHEEAIVARLRAMGVPAAMRHLADEMSPALYKLAERAFGYAPGWSSCRLKGDLAASARSLPPPRRKTPLPARMAWSDGHSVSLRA